MDISRAYQEIKSLPDEALARELDRPSGMVPSYLVMAEMEDRKALRASSSGNQQSKMSMKDELLSGIQSLPAPQPAQPQPQTPPGIMSMVPGYAAGGEVKKPRELVQNPMVDPGTRVVLDSGVSRAMPSLNSGLMQRDMQGWQMLRGNMDWTAPGVYAEQKGGGGGGIMPAGETSSGGITPGGMPLPPMPMEKMNRRNPFMFEGEGIVGLTR